MSDIVPFADSSDARLQTISKAELPTTLSQHFHADGSSNFSVELLGYKQAALVVSNVTSLILNRIDLVKSLIDPESVKTYPLAGDQLAYQLLDLIEPLITNLNTMALDALQAEEISTEQKRLLAQLEYYTNTLDNKTYLGVMLASATKLAPFVLDSESYTDESIQEYEPLQLSSWQALINLLYLSDLAHQSDIKVVREDERLAGEELETALSQILNIAVKYLSSKHATSISSILKGNMAYLSVADELRQEIADLGLAIEPDIFTNNWSSLINAIGRHANAKTSVHLRDTVADLFSNIFASSIPTNHQFAVMGISYKKR